MHLWSEPFIQVKIGGKNKMKKRLLSIILTVCMVLTLLPTAALAADGSDQSFTVTGGESGTDYTYTGGVLTVLTNTALTIANTDNSTPTTDRIEVTSAANITLAGVNIDVSSTDWTAAFKITSSAGAVSIMLADSSVNTLKSGGGCAGLQKDTTAEGTMLTIGGTGTLNAIGKSTISSSTYVGSGIGGAYDAEGSYITISGGTVNATTDSNAAGIGGGANACGSNITITGGTINATGGNMGAGIGGGIDGSGSNITISGGTVNTIATGYAAGIGGGLRGANNNITITGGSVKASSIGGTPTNGAGNVYKAVIPIAGDTTGGTDVNSMTFTSGGTAYTYNMNGAKSILDDGAGKVYVYLPGLSAGIAATASFDGNTYYGSVKNDNAAVLALPTYGVALNPTTDKTFTAATVGYGAQTAYGVTVSNSGNQPTGALTVALTGTNADSFTLSKTTIDSLAVSGSDSFTVVPATGLSTGTYTATVTVSGEHSISAGFNVSFTVNPALPPVSTVAISGVTAPVAGETPVTTITECDQYTGMVTWSGSPGTFGSSTAYTATITLSPKAGYTLTGVTENFFTVAGANTVTNSANSGVITAVFPATGAAPLSEHHNWDGVSGNGIGFNYGDNKFINITMPTTDNYYTYGTAASNGTAAEIASNAKTLPASGWNWAVQKETTTVYSDIYDYTLTLNNFNISSTTTENDGLMFKKSLNLVLNGTNVINTPNGGSALSGNNTECNLHISGTGSLTVAGKDFGINGAGTLAISGGTINASSTSTNSYVSGLLGLSGVTISGGTVTAQGGNYGIRLNDGSFVISGGTVTAKGGAKALSLAPTLSNVAALASANDDGSGATAYNSADNDTYKWFYAKPRKTVNYVGNDSIGGSVPDSQIYASDETVTVPGNTGNLVKSGFTFAGWNDGTNTYQPGATYSMPTNNVTFTAQWTQNAPPSVGGSGGSTPLVTHINNGGSTTGSNLNRLVSGGKTLTVDSDKGAKLVFQTEAIKGIVDQTSGNIKVQMKDVSTDHQDSQPGKIVFSLALTSGDKTITDFGGAVTVTLPYTLKSGETAQDVTVWYLASDGTMTEIPCTYDPVTKLATFTVTHFSLYVVGVPWVNLFTDVSENDWFYNAVKFANQNGLFAGTGVHTFSPKSPMTRAMLWTVLGRLDGQNLSGSGVFDAARSWAMGAGITDGTNPDGSITREQMVTILWRYAGSPKSGGDLSKFSDAGRVAGYAADAMAWAVESGIVAGTNGALLPQDNTTRAQVAAILQRFMEATVK